MKIRPLVIFSILFNLGLVVRTFAQKASPPPLGDVIYFENVVTDSMRASGVHASSMGIKSLRGNRIWLHNKDLNNPVRLGVKLNPALTNYRLSPVRSFYKNYAAFSISDQSDATLIALGITKNNIDNFRYHAVVNDSAEVIHWSPIPKLEQRYGADIPYGFIGKFNYPGKQVLVEIVNIKDYRLRDGVVFDWRKNFRPIITSIAIHGKVPLSPVGTDHETVKIVDRKPPHDHYVKYENVTGTPSEIKFAYDSVSHIEVVLKDHESVQYNIRFYKIENEKDPFDDLSVTESNFQTDLTIFIRRDYQPGNYEIVIQPFIDGSAIEGQETRVRVTILPRPVLERKVLLKNLLIFLFAGLVIIRSAFIIYRRRADIKLARSVQEKQTVSLKLMAIRSQLNPHFMFNALTSIQNLVNKKDIESANHYLSRFADLTRKVLNTGDRDLISLEDELKILDDYLQMEQLRFNFKYELNVGNGVNAANTEVPAMLLQPFVENAVKHGVAKLREQGLIKIEISQPGKDLVFSIIDNGPGFKQKQEDGLNSSFGLKLSEERIGLLNEIYKTQPTKLNIRSAETGTHVTVTLTNWVS